MCGPQPLFGSAHESAESLKGSHVAESFVSMSRGKELIEVAERCKDIISAARVTKEEACLVKQVIERLWR